MYMHLSCVQLYKWHHTNINLKKCMDYSVHALVYEMYMH